MWKTLRSLQASDMPSFVTPELLEGSYERCRLFDISANQERLGDTFGEGETRNLLQQNARLLAYGRTVVEEYMADIQSCQDLFILTNAEERVLGLWSCLDVLAAASEIGLRPGASLAEGSAGTNAVALALAAQGPVVLKGEEHLCRLFHDWSCAAAPILSAEGTLMGCLDLSAAAGPVREKLALTRSLAREIGRLVGNRRSGAYGVTVRQREVLLLFSQGYSYKEIGRDLMISIKTVEEHLDAVRTKLGTKSRRACIKKAIELGVL